MNRRRNETRTPASVFVAMILCAATAAGGGVLHVYYKNRQVQANRDLDAIDRRIEQSRLDMRTTQMRMDQLLNRFVIRKQLAENGSSLIPISSAIVEEVNPTQTDPRAVASAAP
jgi:hypothetical protein